MLLFCQLVGFAYLTFWELSWDVMEPIAYFVSVFYSLIAYIYFFVTRGSYFDYGPFRQYWTERAKVGSQFRIVCLLSVSILYCVVNLSGC